MRGRIIKIALSLVLAAVMFGGGYWAGVVYTNNVWANFEKEMVYRVEEEMKHHKLTDLRACLFQADSALMHSMYEPEGSYSQTASQVIEVCYSFLEMIAEGQKDPNVITILDETALILREYLLIYNALGRARVRLDVFHIEEALGLSRTIEILETSFEIKQNINRLEELLAKVQASIHRAW